MITILLLLIITINNNNNNDNNNNNNNNNNNSNDNNNNNNDNNNDNDPINNSCNNATAPSLISLSCCLRIAVCIHRKYGSKVCRITEHYGHFWNLPGSATAWMVQSHQQNLSVFYSMFLMMQTLTSILLMTNIHFTAWEVQVREWLQSGLWMLLGRSFQLTNVCQIHQNHLHQYQPGFWSRSIRIESIKTTSIYNESTEVLCRK